jgi:hypothetical protein
VYDLYVTAAAGPGSPCDQRLLLDDCDEAEGIDVSPEQVTFARAPS